MSSASQESAPLSYEDLVAHESAALRSLRDSYAAGRLSGEDVAREIAAIVLARLGGLDSAVRDELRAALLETLAADPFCSSARDALDGFRSR